MKKLLAMLLALVMTMGLMACGAQPDTSNTDGDAAVTKITVKDLSLN